MISDNTKLVGLGTLLVLFVFGGGSIFMTYRAANKNTPPPSPVPHPSTFDLISPTPTPALKLSITPTLTPKVIISPQTPTLSTK